nr:TIGR01440 family protein [uncultured Ligilactobacillus sp.]
MDLAKIKQDLTAVLTDYFNNDKFELKPGSLFVVGCSTSMIRGEWMGTDSALSIGKTVYETLQEFLKPRKIDLAIQGCEHINRALLMERGVAEKHDFEIVSVMPSMHAGGGTQVAAYEAMQDPVEVEHIVAQGGIDIGGTDIGMHVKFVQVPVRLNHHKVGAANVTGLYTRSKLIGGHRALYTFSDENKIDHGMN